VVYKQWYFRVEVGRRRCLCNWNTTLTSLVDEVLRPTDTAEQIQNTLLHLSLHPAKSGETGDPL